MLPDYCHSAGLNDLEHGTTPHSASWQYLQTLTNLLAPCPCFPDILLSFTFSVVPLVVLDDNGLETFRRRRRRLADHRTTGGGLHYLIMLWGTKLMFRYLPVSEMGEKGRSISLTVPFLSMVKYSFSDTDCYYQVHAGGFMDPGPGNLDPHSQNCALKTMFWSSYSINKNQGLTEGHRNLSYTHKGSS